MKPPGYVEAEQFELPLPVEFERAVPSPDRERRRAQWSAGRGRPGKHPLCTMFMALPCSVSHGMFWLVNRSAYYPRGVWERVPDPFDIPWLEVVLILNHAKARLNPAWIDLLIASILAKAVEDLR